MSTSASVLDTRLRPLRDLRISVTDRCNFRCPYCMPGEQYGEHYRFLPRAEILTYEEIERLARLFCAAGVTKLRLTGGEPLLRARLPELVRRLAELRTTTGDRPDLALTTNGVLLADAAGELAAAGLSRVTVSLDSLDPEVFARMSGRERAHPDVVLAGIDAAADAGLGPVKINCVVQRGVNDHTIVDLARHFRWTGHVVRYIEFMDVGTLNRWDRSAVVTGAEIVARLGAELPLVPVAPNYRGEVARRWRWPDGSGEIGVITSVSQPFCGDCTRARLSTGGRLVTCLFAATGTDLLGPMRSGASDDELASLIVGCWTGRSDRYSEERAGFLALPTVNRRSAPRRRRLEMFQIGG